MNINWRLRQEQKFIISWFAFGVNFYQLRADYIYARHNGPLRQACDTNDEGVRVARRGVARRGGDTIGTTTTRPYPIEEATQRGG
jgi:hypothetical protein